MEGSAQATFDVELAEALFPRMAQGAGLKLMSLELIALVKDPAGWPNPEVTATTGTNTQTAPWMGSEALYAGHPSALFSYPSGAAPGAWAVSVPTTPLGSPADWADDLLLVATYQIELPLG